MKFKIYISFLFLICVSSINYAHNADGFYLINKGYYLDAIKCFEENEDSTSKIGLQYCYLVMNNINFDREITEELLFSTNLPDSIYGDMAYNMICSYNTDSLKLEFGSKIINSNRMLSASIMRSIYQQMADSYKRTGNYIASIEMYRQEIDILTQNTSTPFSTYRIKTAKKDIILLYDLLGDTDGKNEFMDYCVRSNIDTIVSYGSPSNNLANSVSILDPNENYDAWWLSLGPKSHRDSLVAQIQMVHIPLDKKLELCLELVEYDSVHPPLKLFGSLVKDLENVASIYNKLGNFSQEKRYLEMAYNNMSKRVLLSDVTEMKKILVKLVNNAITRKDFRDAEKYENQFANLFSTLYGFNEYNYDIIRPKLYNGIKYGKLYNFGIGTSWDIEIFELSQHLIRKASVLYFQGRYKEALEECDKSDMIMENAIFLTSNTKINYHLKYETDLILLRTRCHIGMGNYSSIPNLLSRALERSKSFYWEHAVLPHVYKSNMGLSLTIYTDRDRNLFVQKTEDLKNLIYQQTCLHENDELKELAYNQCLYSKHILLHTSNIINKLAIETNNVHYATMIALQAQMEQYYNNVFAVDSLKKIIATEERLLIKDVYSSLAQQGSKTIFCSTPDIILNLSNQVAIEYMVAPLNEDSTMYCALLLRDTCSYPIMIPLFNEPEVTNIVNTTTENQTSYTYSYNGNGKELSLLIWRKILPYIKQGETIYFAPSGILHQLAIETLPYDESHTMGDMFNLVRLSSTREIVTRKDEFRQSSTATLYGGIQYNMDADELLTESEAYKTTDLLASRGIECDTLNRGTITYLKGTKSEAENINALLKQNNLQVQLFTAKNANEESFKALSGKHRNILHIATHGFYWSDSTAQKKDYFSQRVMRMGDDISTPPSIDPLNRCGLLFAGAQTAWSGHSAELPEGVQDGILTAKEISLLDLRDADLVVLSACETGKGEITGDGVFGLQRAFKQAGAQTIVMSLWPVNDAATQLLMTEFYRNWITNHQSKREAFRNAQNTVRSIYEEPVYWAGFIMLD